MTDYVVRVAGPSADLETFRKELLRELKAEGIPSKGLEFSDIRPARRRPTDPAPLGRVEWVEIGIKIIVGVLTPVVADLVKEIIRRRSKSKSLKTEEQETAHS